MVCYHPMKAFQSVRLNPDTGKRYVSFRRPYDGHMWTEILLPCGQCVGCRLDRSRQWAIRCYHEAQLYDDNCFITLTFDDEHLHQRDHPWSLDVRDFQLFMKRLRKRFGSGIRFYHCGEYGEICFNCGKSKKFCQCGSYVPHIGRPHYHACLFNFDFSDKTLWKVKNGCRLYISEILSELWPFGFSSIGDVTFQSAAYVARYIMKKQNGDMAEMRYFDRDGVVVCSEYTTMSRRPGIGKPWLDKYGEETYRDDYVVVNGTKMKPPKFYDRCFDVVSPDEMADIKARRMRGMKKHLDNNTPDRLEVREACQLARMKRLPRYLD
jgi:hypothetical protein